MVELLLFFSIHPYLPKEKVLCLFLKNFNLIFVSFFQLWEQSQLDNSKLRDDLARTRDELTTAKKKLDTVVQVIHSSLEFEIKK